MGGVENPEFSSNDCSLANKILEDSKAYNGKWTRIYCSYLALELYSAKSVGLFSVLNFTEVDFTFNKIMSLAKEIPT